MPPTHYTARRAFFFLLMLRVRVRVDILVRLRDAVLLGDRGSYAHEMPLVMSSPP